MTEFRCLAIVRPDPVGAHWTQVPALPGCGSQGETMDTALENTKEAIRSYLGSLKKHGEPVPEDHSVVVTVTVAA